MVSDTGCLCLGGLLGTAEHLSVPTLGTIDKGDPGTVLHVGVCVGVCTFVCVRVHTCALWPHVGPLQSGMLRTSCLGEFHGHQLGDQLAQGSARFPSILLGSPRGWTHGPSAIRAQASLATETLVLASEGPGGSFLCRSRGDWSRSSDVFCKLGEHSASVTAFPMFAIFGKHTLINTLNTLGQPFFC